MNKRIKLVAMFLVVMMLISACPLMTVKAAAEAEVTDSSFAFYYSQLSKSAQALYNQIYFDTYDESDPGTAYSLVTVDLSTITTDEIYECLEAYWKDNSFLKYVYDISALQIYDLNEYYKNSLLLSLPLLTENETTIDILYEYLYFADEVAIYYSDDSYEAIKTLVLTIVDLVHADLLSAQDAFTFLETGLEYINFPAITIVPNADSVNEYTLIYVFLEGNWYAIDLFAELEAEYDDSKIYLLGEAETPETDCHYAYPKLASTRYIHTYYEIDYSLEKRPCETDEICEETELFHLYFFNTPDEPTTHYNIKNSNGELISFSTVHEFYVPLTEFPGYTVSTIVSYGETRDVISNYTGPAIYRSATTWWEYSELSDLTMYTHHENKIVTGYRYTKLVTE